MRNFSQANKYEYNRVVINGVIYNHSLEEKVSRKGVTYIGGDIEVATDDDLLNIVKVNYSYEPMTRMRNGKESENFTYNTLKNIIVNGHTASKNGKDMATTINITGNIEKNDYVNRQTGEMIEQTRIRGGFIHEGARGEWGAKFDADMLISGYDEKESRDGSVYGVIKGYVFNYRNDFLPVQFNVSASSGGMDYFASADMPMLTHVWGDIVTSTVAVQSETAFGVRASSRTFRSWEIAGAAGEPYEYGAEDVMTVDDVKAGLEARKQHLAEVRAEDEERKKAEQGNGFAKPASKTEAAPAAYTDDFVF